MKIKCVSLINSTNREVFVERFKELDYEFFDAIDGRLTQDNFSNEKFFYKYNRIARPGEIGCSLSHYALFKSLIYSDDDSLLILEDDAKPELSLIQLCSDLERFNTESPTIIILGHSKTIKNNLFVQRLKQPLKDKIEIGKCIFGKNSRITRVGTVAYYINKSAANILASMKEIYWLADEWSLISSFGINVYHPVDPVIYEDLDSVSSTGNSVHINHNIYDRFFLQLAAIIKSQILYFLGKI